jgi:glutamate racemase
MKIGVFDSGVGGLSVAQVIEKAEPQHEVLFRNDAKHVPYGNKPAAEVLSYIVPIFQEMIDEGCEIIVVACNTVSTTLIESLRQRFEVPFIAMEPMVKPAAELTEKKIIAVCATPATLASDRYKWLKETYAQGITIYEPDCSDWAFMIEQKTMEEEKIRECLLPALEAGADVIVLGCTHYHWIEEEIKAIAVGHAMVLQPETAIVKQLERVIEQLA